MGREVVIKTGLLAWLAVLCLAVPALGQETKTFPKERCSYTLPGPDWEWLDPALGKKKDPLAMAKNQAGVTFFLLVEPLDGAAPGPNWYEPVERGFLKSGKMKKIRGGLTTFKGLPAYQIDAEVLPGVTSTCRFVNANDNLYASQVVYGAEDPAVDVDSIFAGFEFVGDPEPAFPSDVAKRAEKVGEAIATLGVITGVIVLGVYVLRKKKSPAARR